MLKSIYIKEELHRELKIYAANHNNSISNIVENAVGNLINQKAANTTVPQNSSKVVSTIEGLTKGREDLRGDDYV